MIVREFLDKLNIKEEDVIQIGENSYSRNELYSLPKNELIFDKDVSEIYINVHDGWQYDDTGKEFLVGFTTVICIEVEEE